MLNIFTNFKFYLKGFFLLLLLHTQYFGYSQSTSTCPEPIPTCIPKYKATSILPDTAYFNCTLSKVLNPGLDQSGAILYRWEAPDGTISSSANLIAKDGLEGFYKLCYDTAGPFSGCPRSDQVYVTKFTKQLANAGVDKNACSNRREPIGTSPSNPNYTYSWTLPNYLVGGTLNKSDQIFFGTNTTPTPQGIAIVQIVTDKKTECKSTDTVKILLSPLPILRIDGLKSSYCAGDYSIIRLGVYNNNFNKMSPSFSINGITQILPAAKDTFFRLIPNNPTLYPGKVFEFPLSTSTSGIKTLNFSFTSEFGCSTKIDSTINVNVASANISITSFSAGQTLCNTGENVVPLTAITGAGVPATLGTFSASPSSNAITKDATNNFFFDPNKALPGINIVTYTEPKGSGAACGASGSDTIIIIQTPTPNVIGRTSVCPGSQDAEYKDISNYPGVVRTWQDATPNITLTQNLNSENDSVSVDYSSTSSQASFTLVNRIGTCTAQWTQNVTIKDAVQSDTPKGDSVICTGYDSVLYSAELGSKYQHQWFVKGGTIDPKYKKFSDAQSAYVKWNPGEPEYLLYVRDSSTVDPKCFGNSDTLKIKFTVDPYPKFLNPDTIICLGEKYNLQADPAGGNTFTWTPGDLSGPSVTVEPKTTTIYTLTVRKGTACPEKSAVTKVYVQPIPKGALQQNDFRICFEEDKDTVITALKDNPANTLEWENDPSETAVNFTVLQAGTYSVIQTDAFGCFSKDSVAIGDNCPVRLFIPQAFSPNQDGINDILTIFGNDNFENFQFRIFDRWGEVMYSTTDVKNPWTGEYNGKIAASGTYPWVLTYEIIGEKDKKETITKKGSISLIK